MRSVINDGLYWYPSLKYHAVRVRDEFRHNASRRKHHLYLL